MADRSSASHVSPSIEEQVRICVREELASQSRGRKPLNPVNFFLLIVIEFLILLKVIKFLRLNEITLVDFDDVIILNGIVLVECDCKIRY